MKTNSHHATSQSKSPAVRLLIPRSQRRTFLFQFTLMTVLGWVVGGIVSLAIEKILWQGFLPFFAEQPQIWSFWVKILGNIVFALVFAADQALVMRRYISGWRWMLATSIGWLLANAVSTAWINYIANLFNQPLAADTAFALGLLSTLPYILSGVWLGLLQWLVLRSYTFKSWWWNFLPSISFFCISLVVWLLSFIQNLIPVPVMSWIEQGFTAMILGVIPAIGLCTLKKQLQRQTGISSFPSNLG
ncbi:hypothetical protein CLI64_06975 [Nostoc sp. CENA543]|uniref:hypothetical protein n=1 Tax=Nostoc sp. CENA543 TaxID=1869241 RepID=UPI000CA2A84F|nr:hypothetical protein [Nostoc sp. CENA543]AUT00142.1 hypothetical protein CLI64_06975 [Nostoc sp. CENA543]